MNARTISSIGFFLLLISCVQQELPPLPPSPGGESAVGRAIGGVLLSNTSLPIWAGPLLYTDIEPSSVKESNTVKLTVEKPSFVTTKFYIHAFSYFYNKKSRVWEKVPADSGLSGKIIQQWAENKAVFTFSANQQRFDFGNNFIIVYWCIDTDTRDTNGNKIWNCNSKKWGLGAFEMRQTGFAELIETNIGSNQYKNSTRSETAEGTEFSAEYESTSGTKMIVKLLKFKNYSAQKQTMSQNIAYLESIYSLRGNVCGFLIPSATTSFAWFTNDSRITVQTLSSTLDDSKVSAYSARYLSNCQILDEVKRAGQGQSGYCGNSVIDGPEQCDGTTDFACQGLCKPDCSCAIPGASNTGLCGDFQIQKPNSQQAVENCEPPEKRDVITGQIKSGSVCYLRDPFTSAISGTGHCNDQCGCVAGIAVLPKCGNGKCETDESVASCSLDCPNDTFGPLISVSLPLEGQPYLQTLTYNLSAADLSGVAKCEASTDNGTLETMTKTGLTWTIAKTLGFGNHTAVFTCTDTKSNTSTQTRNFVIKQLATNIEIKMQNIAFDPFVINITAGSNVTWVNNDATQHTATSTSGPSSFDTGIMNQTGRKTLQFNTPGTYNYTCQIHPTMKGTITVT